MCIRDSSNEAQERKGRDDATPIHTVQKSNTVDTHAWTVLRNAFTAVIFTAGKFLNALWNTPILANTMAFGLVVPSVHLRRNIQLPRRVT
eukprot:5422152-Prymnesium_polylepis.1